MRADAPCPRCGSTDLHHYVVSGSWGDADQSSCEDCEHVWGDGLPDSQAELLPTGMADCVACDGRGDDYGRRCGPCRGDGILVETEQ